MKIILLITLGIFNSQTNPAYEASLDDIFTLANQCHLTGGNAVFAARNLYNTLTFQNYNFDVECELSSSPLARKKQKNITKAYKTNSNNEIVVYPNPSKDGYIYITLPTISKPNWLITVTDINGKTIELRNIRNSINKTFINLTNTAKGLYFIKIHEQNSNQFVVKKIIFE
jgi:hypothetical protein